MKYSLKPAVLALALPFLAFAADPTPQEAAPSVPVPTIAVLPFDSRGARAQNENLGRSIAELLSVELASQGEFELVERDPIASPFVITKASPSIAISASFFVGLYLSLV